MEYMLVLMAKITHRTGYVFIPLMAKSITQRIEYMMIPMIKITD